jgi:hypothetical protein
MHLTSIFAIDGAVIADQLDKAGSRYPYGDRTLDLHHSKIDPRILQLPKDSGSMLQEYEQERLTGELNPVDKVLGYPVWNIFFLFCLISATNQSRNRPQMNRQGQGIPQEESENPPGV